MSANLTVTDLFAGAGGSSTGMVDVPGVEVVMAANHWKLAIAVHNQNHPGTDHAAVDLHEENPRGEPAVFPAYRHAVGVSRVHKMVPGERYAATVDRGGSVRGPTLRRGCAALPPADVRRAEVRRPPPLPHDDRGNVVDIALQAKYRLAWRVWRQELVKLGYRFRVITLNSMHAQTFGLPAPQSRDRLYGWAPVVKELRDDTQLAGDAVVLTGSSAADLDEARRSLGAGRTGVATPCRLLLPMTFRDYLVTTAVDVPLPDPVSPDELQSEPARSAVMQMAPFVDEFDLAWQRFLECGGFPRAVGEYQRLGRVHRPSCLCQRSASADCRPAFEAGCYGHAIARPRT